MIGCEVEVVAPDLDLASLELENSYARKIDDLFAGACSVDAFRDDHALKNPLMIRSFASMVPPDHDVQREAGSPCQAADVKSEYRSEAHRPANNMRLTPNVKNRRLTLLLPR